MNQQNAVQPPLWHRTRTVDYVVVISGEIDLMVDDSVVHLKAGDTVVQQANQPRLGQSRERSVPATSADGREATVTF